jgi:hypothetical protein
MPFSPLAPIPFVTGAGPSGKPLPLRQRLTYMRQCVSARVDTTTIFAAVPSPRARVAQTRVRGLASRLVGSEVRLQSERDCYGKIQMMVEVLHVCMRAPGFDTWYIVNSLLMRQCAYLSLYFILGNAEYEQFQANIALIWVRIPSPGRYVAAVLSRQVGKTAVLATYLALMLALGRSDDAVSGIALYAQGAGLSEATLSESTNLLRYVYDVIRTDPMRKHIILNTVQSTSISKITIEMPAQWNRQVFWAVAKPGRVNNVRGSREVVIIVDEASFLDPKLMQRHIIPIMLKTRSGALMTTPSTNTEPGTDMMQDWIENPKENFKQGTAEQLSLVCPACYVLPNATQCRHNLSFVPPWKETADLLHSIRTAKSSILREDLERELLGYNPRRVGCVFPNDVIRKVCVFTDEEIRPELMAHRVIYVTVDPSIGSRSDLAIMCWVIHRDRFICIGAENVSMKNCGNEEGNVVMRSLFISLREQFPELLRTCEICPLVESNGNNLFVTDLFRILQLENFPVTVQLNRHGLQQQALRGGNQTSLGGVLTRLPAKEEGVNGIFDLARNEKIAFSTRMASSCIARFVTGSIRADTALYRTHYDDGEPLRQRTVPPLINVPERLRDRDMAVASLLKLLDSQMSAMVRTEKGDISGKGASKRENDDFAMVLIISICFITRIAGSQLPLDLVFRI